MADEKTIIVISNITHDSLLSNLTFNCSSENYLFKVVNFNKRQCLIKVERKTKMCAPQGLIGMQNVDMLPVKRRNICNRIDNFDLRHDRVLFSSHMLLVCSLTKFYYLRLLFENEKLRSEVECSFNNATFPVCTLSWNLWLICRFVAEIPSFQRGRLILTLTKLMEITEFQLQFSSSLGAVNSDVWTLDSISSCSCVRLVLNFFTFRELLNIIFGSESNIFSGQQFH